MKYLTLFLGFLTLVLGGCDPLINNCSTELKFNIPNTISDPKKTISLGDSIVIEASFSDTFADISTGIKYKLPIDSLPLTVAILKLDTLGGYENADLAKFFSNNGTFIKKQFDYDQEVKYAPSSMIFLSHIAKNRFTYKFVITPQKIGPYWIILSAKYLWGSQGENIDLIRGCSDKTFMTASINNQIDNNWETLEKYKPTLIGVFTKTDFDDSAGYVFEVK